VVVTCFASHIHRVQQVVGAALATGRKVAFLGRSMTKNVELARRLHLLDVPDDAIVDIEDVDEAEPGEVCVISTGSQGEPLSALALMAGGESKWLRLRPGDVVVISAHPVPGNEWAVGRVIDGLYRRGAEVIHSDVEPVHVSGHARQGELQMLLSVTRPEWFIPVHGEYRHMVNHVQLALRTGVDEKKAMLCEDGDSVVLDDEGMHRGEPVPAGFLYVDGTVGDVGHGVLRDRRVLAEEGVVVVVATVDVHAGDVVTNPEIVTRGWVHAPEAEALLGEASDTVRDALNAAMTEGVTDHEALRRHARRALGRFVGERTRRRPMIVPVVVCV
jgi:ribonuclease J